MGGARGRSPLGPRRRTRGAGARAAYLAPLPVSLLRARPALAQLPEALERLGIQTLGELAALPPAAVADRFGALGLLAHELARGGDSALSPRPASELVRESLDLPEAASGLQLERGLGLLIDRLLARRERRGRTLRAVVISAVLVEQGGTWRDGGGVPRGAGRSGADAPGPCSPSGEDAGAGGSAAAGRRALRSAGV